MGTVYLCCYLLAQENFGYINCCPLLLVRNTSSDGKKIPNREFYWSADQEFPSRLGILKCKSAWSTDKCVRKFMILRKRKKLSSKVFLQAIGNSDRKNKVSEMEVSIQNSAVTQVSFKAT